MADPPVSPTQATAEDELPAERFMASLRLHQEALWAVLCHGTVVVSTGWNDFNQYEWFKANIYRPSVVGNLNVSEWWEQYKQNFTHALENAGRSAFPGAEWSYTLHWIVPVPDELADFVAQHSVRPRASRFTSTAVEFYERDGIVWLTPPELRLYDRLKAAGWTFVPQPAVVFGEESYPYLSPDFLIYWGGRADQAVMVEVDSDMFHSKPSQREKDEWKERRFQSLGFGYLRFSAKSCLQEPLEVIAEIQKFCMTKFGPSKGA